MIQVYISMDFVANILYISFVFDIWREGTLNLIDESHLFLGF